MEHTEPLKSGNDPDCFSKRRISSILKAPRTSMKAFGVDQDENQIPQLETRTIEKRRNSRRVSFATTDNVHVFSKDIKTDSPVQAPIQNKTAFAVCDGQDKNTMLHFDTRGNQPGLDTMLSMPLHISQLNRGNFFPDPVLHDECVDRTMLLGEDTGYMDMTHSHTITIDKEERLNSELGFSVLENITGLHNVKRQKEMPTKAIGQVEKDTMQLEFNNFLASISKPGSQNIVASSKKKTKGLQLRCSPPSFLEQENMDMTKSHTVVIDRSEIAQHDPVSVCGNHKRTDMLAQSFSNDSDDMEITRSQTATINFKVTDNEKCLRPLDADRKSSFVSDDTSGMVMTQVFGGFLQEHKEPKISKGEAVTVLPKASIISSFSQPENRQISDENRVDHFQNNLLLDNTTDCDDMEITQSQTVVLETKCGRQPFGKSFVPLSSSRIYEGGRKEFAPKLTGLATLDGIVAAESGERKKNATLGEETVFSNDQSDLMELTCQAGTSLMVISPDDMELTASNNVIIDSDVLATREIISRKRTSFMQTPSVSAETKKNCVRSDHSVLDVNDCMEMTQCQTIVLETNCGREPLDKSKVSSFPLSSFRMYDGDRVEFAPKLTGHVIPGGLVAAESRERKTNVMSGEETVLQSDQSDLMELTCQANTSVLSPDDMELTGCTNVTIDSKSILAKREIIPRKRAFFMQTPSVSAETKRNDCGRGDLSVFQPNDDMEMTQCQTVVLESKHCVEHKPFSILKKGLPTLPASRKSDISSKKRMEMAQELTGHAVLNGHSYSETERYAVPGAQTFQQKLPDDMEIKEGSVNGMSAIQDDMEMTGCKTITIDMKSTSQAGAKNIPQQVPSLLTSRSAVFDDEIGMAEVVLKTPEKVPPTQVADCDSQVAEMNVDAGNPLDNHRKSYIACKGQAGLIDPSSCGVSSLVKESSSHNLIDRNLESLEKDCDMEMTSAFTVPLEEQCPVDFKHGDAAVENPEPGTAEQKTFKEVGDHSLMISKPTEMPVQSEMYPTECEIVKNDPSRRKSLAEIQEKLQNIAQCISDPNDLLTGRYTAPVPNFTVSEESLVDECCERQSSTEPVKETSPLKNVSSANAEGSTPFNLKSFLMARLSLGGITPKLPSRTKSASPYETEPVSTNRYHSLHLEAQLGDNIQSCSYPVNNIENEVLPEDDLSETVLSNISNEKGEQDTCTVAPLAKGATEDDVNISTLEMKSCVIEKATDGKRNKEINTLGRNDSGALWIQNASGLMTKMTDDTCTSSNSTNMKCEGASESTLRNSQFDSQIDRTMDHEFDFKKALEDATITVNEFLSHFSVNSVIHKSRPSAVPDHFRVAHTCTMKDLLKEQYIYRPKQRVYEAECQKLTEMTERLKPQMADQDKLLKDINGTLLQEMCDFSDVQLQRFGAKLKERRAYFRKRSKAFSHEMKNVLYSELLKRTRESKQTLLNKIEEAKETLKDLDACVNNLESELETVDSMLKGDQLSLIGTEPLLIAKQQDLDAINSEVVEAKRQICDLEHQKVTFSDTLEKRKDEVKELEYRITALNSLNEWRVHSKNENGAVFTFLHNTVHLDIKLKNCTEKDWMHEDVEHDVDISFRFLLNGECSQPYASMVHKLLAESFQTQPKWMQKYPTTRHIPVLLHDVSLVVSRLRLLGEEIHRLQKWGGSRFGILNITCVDTIVEIVFSSVKAFAKFEISLAVTPDYPLSPLQMRKFQNHIGDTRAAQIENIISSVTPAKNQLTKVIQRIHSDLFRETCF